MKKIIKNPHLFFFGLIPIFIIIGLIKKDTPLNINISYIYYLVNVDYWCYISAVYCGLIGINYLALSIVKKYPQKWLTVIHIFMQLICVLPYFYSVYHLDEYGNLSNGTFLNASFFNSLLLAGFIIFLLSILVHLINFFTSLLLKRD